MRRTGKLKSDIPERDIEIKFDRNRLDSLTETVNNLKTLIGTGVKPIDALKVSPIFEDNGSVAEGIEETIKETRQHELSLKQSSSNTEINNNQQGDSNGTEKWIWKNTLSKLSNKILTMVSNVNNGIEIYKCRFVKH